MRSHTEVGWEVLRCYPHHDGGGDYVDDAVVAADAVGESFGFCSAQTEEPQLVNWWTALR